MYNHQVFTAECRSNPYDACFANGVSQCNWTLAEIIIKPDRSKEFFIEKTTTLIINSNSINFNGIEY